MFWNLFFYFLGVFFFFSSRAFGPLKRRNQTHQDARAFRFLHDDKTPEPVGRGARSIRFLRRLMFGADEVILLFFVILALRVLHVVCCVTWPVAESLIHRYIYSSWRRIGGSRPQSHSTTKHIPPRPASARALSLMRPVRLSLCKCRPNF